MSGGLGWLQQRVLAYLDDQGGWGWAFEVALNLAEQQADQNQPSSRALEVSVRRAVHTLARRGVVRVGYYPLGEAWDAHRPLSLLLWRPEAESHVQALLAPRRRWVDDDATVLRVLRAIGQEDVDAWW